MTYIYGSKTLILYHVLFDQVPHNRLTTPREIILKIRQRKSNDEVLTLANSTDVMTLLIIGIFCFGTLSHVTRMPPYSAGEINLIKP